MKSYPFLYCTLVSPGPRIKDYFPYEQYVKGGVIILEGHTNVKTFTLYIGDREHKTITTNEAANGNFCFSTAIENDGYFSVRFKDTHKDEWLPVTYYATIGHPAW